jgi:hypothetical protein
MVLRCLSEDMDAETALAIVEARAEAPFGTVQDLRGVPGLGGAVAASFARCATTSPGERYYSVTATGRVGDFARALRVVLHGEELNELLRQEIPPLQGTAEAN